MLEAVQAGARPSAAGGEGRGSPAPDDVSRIRANFERFDKDVRQAEAAFARGELETAAFFAATAATVATHNHCGVFASQRLERLLNRIGRKMTSGVGGQAPADPSAPVRRVLHVGTELVPVSGLTRLVSRWIAADPERENSMVLTRHRGEIPQHFLDAVAASGGEIHHLNRRPGVQADWVRALRRLALQYDLVVLHINCEDVIPLLAFADQEGLPPVLFLNHADHIFWLGQGVSRLVLNLRDAATDISVRRRRISPLRNYLLPTIVDPTVRIRSRIEAKAALGVDPGTTLLVSAARGTKYRTLNGVSFADMHADVLERHPEAKLIVVGPGSPADWRGAQERTGGRIVGMPSTPDPTLYFEAADIYVDSYPFVSSTSMMEAGGYGAALISLFTAPDDAQIIAINHVGLVGTALIGRTKAEYDALLERLIVDPAFREERGEAARKALEAEHTPPGWNRYLEGAYALAREAPVLDYLREYGEDVVEAPEFGPLDCMHEGIFGSNYAPAEIRQVYMGELPARQRLARWAEMRRNGEIRGAKDSLRTLVPEWLKRKLAP